MDFHPGGDLATQLSRWGRLGRDRARFYAAEIVEGVEGLHAAGVIYRDLKPENILIATDGHVVLTDFGLSKQFPRPEGPIEALPTWMTTNASSTPNVDPKDVTSSFCGTAEYLAPEVIQGLPYSYEVDWWSLGTMLYEMLAGITPFWASNHSDMYVRVLHDELNFGDERYMDQDTKSLLRGLLQKNPVLRLCEPRIKRHPYFGMLDWDHIAAKRYIPPYIPPTNPNDILDTQNFDETFLDMDPVIDDDDLNASKIDPERAAVADQALRDADEKNQDLFEKYSYRKQNEDGSSIMYEEYEESSNENLIENDEKEKAKNGIESEDDVNQNNEENKKKVDDKNSISDKTSNKENRIEDLQKELPRKKSIKEEIYEEPVEPRKRRREKSGVLAFDRPLLVSSSSNSSIADDEDATDVDNEDDWDLVESDTPAAPNGRRLGPSTLFARGVTDKYKLILRRQNSTINNNHNNNNNGNNNNYNGNNNNKVEGDTSSATTDTDSPNSNRKLPTPPPTSTKRSVGSAITSTLNLRKKRGFLSKSRPTSPSSKEKNFETIRPKAQRIPTTPSKLMPNENKKINPQNNKEINISDDENVKIENEQNTNKTIKPNVNQMITSNRKDLFSIFKN